MAHIEALCVSEKKGMRKRPVKTATFRADFGIEEDAHGGPWHRQVSLLSGTDIDSVRQKGLPDLSAGDFAENVIISGLDLSDLGLGTRLRLGTEVTLSITQIGKVCHAPCRIYYLTGDCIMPRLGLFARVEHGGELHVDDAVAVVERVPRSRYQVVILGMSDTPGTVAVHEAMGQAAACLEQSLDAHVYRRAVLPNDTKVITERLEHYSNGHSIDLILCVGGVVSGGIRGATLVVNVPEVHGNAAAALASILPGVQHELEGLRGTPIQRNQSAMAP